jgi:hydroxypyruvate reductase
MPNSTESLRSTARAIFDEALRSVDAFEAVRRAVSVDGEKLRVVETEYDLRKFSAIYSIAVGKAARPMAKALTDALGQQLMSGVVSAPKSDIELSEHWRTFTGGHPLPNEESFQAARAARAVLEDANDHSSLVIFLFSGGGSALMELPRDERISLKDFQEASRVFVTCGAKIEEINAIRRRLSAIKGGGLDAVLEPHVERVTLLISDTNRGDEANIASGPSLHASDEQSKIEEIIERYDLLSRLPSSVARALTETQPKEKTRLVRRFPYYVLLDNDTAVEAAVKAAEQRGFTVEKIENLVEAEVSEGCARLVQRLIDLKGSSVGPVCLVSGGEFVCKVRGAGFGGRNSEAALRCAIEFSEREENLKNIRVVALHTGTDGIDGNSPAAGAIADETTIARAQKRKMNAADYLARSDSYNFFKTLGDAIEIGPTETNARDLRIFLAS